MTAAWMTILVVRATLLRQIVINDPAEEHRNDGDRFNQSMYRNLLVRRRKRVHAHALWQTRQIGGN